MGLDMLAFRVKKPNLPEQLYAQQEIIDLGYSIVPESYIHEGGSWFNALLPYAQRVKVSLSHLDTEKFKKNFGFEDGPYLDEVGDGYVVYGGKKGDEYAQVTIYNKVFNEEYVCFTDEYCWVYQAETLLRWRNRYEVSHLFWEQLGVIDNGKYFLVPVDLQKLYNAVFGKPFGRLPEEAATDTTAIVYVEWY